MLQFSKYQGLGNDFLIFDNRSTGKNKIPKDPNSEWIQSICSRHFGVGADGIILVLPPMNQGDVYMRIFNADGKEAEMCGNGVRCLTQFLNDSENDSCCSWNIETLSGLITTTLHENGIVSVNMGTPIPLPDAIPTKLCIENEKLPRGTFTIDGIAWDVVSVGVGNPHAVILVEELETIDLNKWGPILENHLAFPESSNIHFAQVLSANRIRMKSWERGVGITLACGTGACAVLVITHSLGLTEQDVEILLPGGSLGIHWQKSDNHLIMTGEAKAIFDGVLTPEITPYVQQTTTTNYSGNTSWKEQIIDAQQNGEILCSKSCIEGCLYPDNCFSRDARRQVSDFMANSSLDDIITIATSMPEIKP